MPCSDAAMQRCGDACQAACRSKGRSVTQDQGMDGQAAIALMLLRTDRPTTYAHGPRSPSPAITSHLGAFARHAVVQTPRSRTSFSCLPVLPRPRTRTRRRRATSTLPPPPSYTTLQHGRLAHPAVPSPRPPPAARCCYGQYFCCLFAAVASGARPALLFVSAA
ncbi:hypothetical protein BDV95DRAFT_327550 [Massariosphaeria phaeospora]|uniref:Uncharacterized protein n=1 Tax=Massariosphaeria phaeospora TaxID=100035 RepID=A0A7C8MCD2_9PLEO|nr:hypothetical protein BDV95DRAFT_327550 [Massariosphaeria phaeospora]